MIEIKQGKSVEPRHEYNRKTFFQSSSIFKANYLFEVLKVNLGSMSKPLFASKVGNFYLKRLQSASKNRIWRYFPAFFNVVLMTPIMIFPMIQHFFLDNVILEAKSLSVAKEIMGDVFDKNRYFSSIFHLRKEIFCLLQPIVYKQFNLASKVSGFCNDL